VNYRTVTLNGGYVHVERIKSQTLLARGRVTDENMGSPGLLSLALLGVALVSVAGNLQVRNMAVLWKFEVMFGSFSVDKSRVVRNYCPPTLTIRTEIYHGFPQLLQVNSWTEPQIKL
jgi:hypothetical protein